MKKLLPCTFTEPSLSNKPINTKIDFSVVVIWSIKIFLSLFNDIPSLLSIPINYNVKQKKKFYDQVVNSANYMD